MSERQKETEGKITLLITGCCGFIGRNLVSWYLRKEAEQEVAKVVGIDCMTYGSDERNLIALRKEGRARFSFYRVEYGDSEYVSEILSDEGITHVIHLAGETNVDRGFEDPVRCADINVTQTVSLVETCRKVLGSRLVKFLYMSTDEVYGDVRVEKASESAALTPTNYYAATKCAAELVVASAHRSYNFPVTVVRSNNVYGPHQSNDKVIPRFVEVLLSGKHIQIHGTGEQTRNWVHVTDVCRAIDAVLKRGLIASTYNIGTTEEHSILAIAEKISDILGVEGDARTIEFIADRPHNDQFYHIEPSKIMAELGWEPSIPFEEGLRETVGSFVKRYNASKEAESGQGESAEVEVEEEEEEEMPLFMIFGHAGWIASQVIDILRSYKIRFIRAHTRPGTDTDFAVRDEIMGVNPTHVLSLLGRTHGDGYKTIDFLEGGADKVWLNGRDNLFAPLLLASICSDLDIHFTYLGTGCIFEYKQDGPQKDAMCSGYKEQDTGNFHGSSYSAMKLWTDRMMSWYAHCTLNVRIRMPVSADNSERNFITKIAGYEKVINIPNSITVLPELLPLMVEAALMRVVGTLNLVNPQAISHNEVLELYKEIIDPNKEIKNFTIEEQSTVVKAARSNCKLDASYLMSLFPGRVSDTATAVRRCLEAMAREGVEGEKEEEQDAKPDSP